MGSVEEGSASTSLTAFLALRAALASAARFFFARSPMVGRKEMVDKVKGRRGFIYSRNEFEIEDIFIPWQRQVPEELSTRMHHDSTLLSSLILKQ
jgi:hypothetical protein